MTGANQRIHEIFSACIEAQEQAQELLSEKIVQGGRMLVDCLLADGKILICGNGGSAADAQHFAAELINRFEHDRPALPALALTSDAAVLTAITNDYCYKDVFKKQVAALGNENDVLVVVTTSGASENLIEAIWQAHKKKMTVLALTGRNGGVVGDTVTRGDLELRVPAENTARIQEVHLTMIHCLCDFIDSELFT